MPKESLECGTSHPRNMLLPFIRRCCDSNDGAIFQKRNWGSA